VRYGAILLDLRVGTILAEKEEEGEGIQVTAYTALAQRRAVKT